MFANISRHPSKIWPKSQVEAALDICPDGIVDITFPYIDPESPESAVIAVADKLAATLSSDGIEAAMVQGEYSLTLYLAMRLAKKGINVYVAALGKRQRDEATHKYVRDFVRFRKILGDNNEH